MQVPNVYNRLKTQRRRSSIKPMTSKKSIKTNIATLTHHTLRFRSSSRRPRRWHSSTMHSNNMRIISRSGSGSLSGSEASSHHRGFMPTFSYRTIHYWNTQYDVSEGKGEKKMHGVKFRYVCTFLTSNKLTYLPFLWTARRPPMVMRWCRLLWHPPPSTSGCLGQRDNWNTVFVKRQHIRRLLKKVTQ